MHISRSETYIATGHKDCSIRMWNAKTKESVFKLEDAHHDPVSCVRVTPDENYIVSTSKDDTIKVWDIRKQALLQTFEHEQFRLGSNNTKFCVSPNS
jgi:WD40 repeat protein